VALEVELKVTDRDGKLLVTGIEGVDVKDCDVLAIDGKDCVEVPSLVVRPAGVVDGNEKPSGVFVRICWVEKTLPRVSTSNC
jgi:hypothetical protein